MARHIGREGSVSISGLTVGTVVSWSYEESVDELEATAMGDDSKVYLGGLRDGSGSVDFRLDEANATQEAIQDILIAGTSVTLSASTGNQSFSGSVVVTSLSINANYNDVVGGTFGYRGALTWV